MGASYLRLMTDYFKGDLELAIMAYNGGAGKRRVVAKRPQGLQPRRPAALDRFRRDSRVLGASGPRVIESIKNCTPAAPTPPASDRRVRRSSGRSVPRSMPPAPANEGSEGPYLPGWVYNDGDWCNGLLALWRCVGGETRSQRRRGVLTDPACAVTVYGHRCIICEGASGCPHPECHGRFCRSLSCLCCPACRFPRRLTSSTWVRWAVRVAMPTASTTEARWWAGAPPRPASCTPSYGRRKVACIDLGTLGGVASFAYGINNQGQVAGWYDTGNSARAFLWTAEGGMQDLGTLGGAFSYAFAINNQGQVVGSSATAFGGVHAFLWTAEGGMQDLSAPGSSFFLAQGINDRGRWWAPPALRWANFTPSCGRRKAASGTSASRAPTAAPMASTTGARWWAESDTPSGEMHACLWTAESGMQDLGTLGGRDSWANGINDRGQVVGESLTASHERHAFLWGAAAGMQDLGTARRPEQRCQWHQRLGAGGGKLRHPVRRQTSRVPVARTPRGCRCFPSRFGPSVTAPTTKRA